MRKQGNRERNHQVKFYLNDDENERLNLILSLVNMDKSTFFRNLIFNNTTKFHEKGELKQLYQELHQTNYELNKIGVNINQIARHVNENNGIIEKCDILELYNQVKSINSSMMEFIMKYR